MSQFYARYVPPSTPSSANKKGDESAKKRKRAQPTESNNGSTKSWSSKQNKRLKEWSQVDERTDAAKVIRLREPSLQPENVDNILDKYRVTEAARTHNEAAEVKLRKKPVTSGKEGKKSKKQNGQVSGDQKERHEQDEQKPFEDGDDGLQKHASIMSKFSKSKARRPDDLDTSKAEPTYEETEIHGLEPIPQPQASEEQPGRPTYSTQPKWQSGATSVDRASRRSFDDMALSRDTLANLKKHNIHNAFPVQSTLIPMLLDQDQDIAGDICVSAATGSGKTLAYIVPIVEALRSSTKPGLRAVIVVPTRELVKQVRETCDLCASGSNLRVVTAVGSKSLKEEQEMLIIKEEIYDPEEYDRRQKALVDWTTFNLEVALENAKANHSISPGFVERLSVKADILITTPGRLVDHLKNTPGFNLDYVQWMVVDEADRLLNESYQEWIEVVSPALSSRAATKERDQILSFMHLDLPPRIVRKILLSATMTQDITKLNALGLRDPKLVVLRSTQMSSNNENISQAENQDLQEPAPDSNGTFNLPATLYESVLTFKDGTEKPLVLLELLKDKLLVRIDARVEQKTLETSDSSSSESNGDSDSESSMSTSSLSSDETSSDESSTDSIDEIEVLKDKEQFASRRPKKNRALIAEGVSTPRVLIFTRSTASASRLSRLLSLLSPDLESKIVTLTRSTASSASSRQALSSFRSGRTTILISTDRASRGIDVPGLEHVINYDIPGSALTYVHRVGRTARAGKGGHAWTLLEHREGRWFWNEIGGKDEQSKIRRSTKVRKVEEKIDNAVLKERYEEALQILGDEVKR